MTQRRRVSRSLCLALLAILTVVSLCYFPLFRTRAASVTATVLPSAWKPLVNLKNPQSLKITYTGSHEAVSALQSGSAKPTALASADFNADGAIDVVAGYSTGNGGVIALFRGNKDAFSPTNPALYPKALKGSIAPTFLSKAQVFSVPESPDLLAAGDFNHDGYPDVLVGTLGSNIYLLAGDGKGNLMPPQIVPLTGQVRALAVLADGHVAVSLDNPNGPELAILSPSAQGLVPSASYPLPASGDSVAWGNLGGGADVAVGAGKNIALIYNVLSAKPQTETIPVPFQVMGLTLGDFIWDQDGRTEISILADDGSVQILQHGTLNTAPLTAAQIPARRKAYSPKNAHRSPNPTALGAWTIAKQLPYTGSAPSGPVSASAFSSPHVAASSTHDVMVLDAGRNQLNILDSSGKTASASAAVSFSGTPVAALALPQKIDASRDMVVLTSAQSAPMLITAGADPTFNVNTTADIDSVSACAQGSTVTTAPATLSLREAVCIANNNGNATSVINVPAGTYSLSLSAFGGSGSASSSPELQVGIQHGNNISIVGAGANSTIIQQTVAGSRVIEADELLAGSMPLAISNLTLQNGNCTDSGLDCLDNGGGAILAGGVTGDTLTLTNVVFNHNSATSSAGTMGGAVTYTGSLLSVTGSTFSNNTASGTGGAEGGGVQAANVVNGSEVSGSVTITNSTFTNNSATGNAGNGNGGGLFFDGGAGFNGSVTGSTFTGNTASSTSAAATGGGINAQADGGVPTFSVGNSRIVGNTAPSTNGSGYFGLGLTNTVTNNWWGCNGGPGASGCDTVVFDLADGGSGAFNPWLVLSISANPTQIETNGTSTLTANLTTNSSGGTGFNVPNGTPVSFGGTLDSSVNPTSTTLTSGQATSTYTAGSTAGTGSGTATVDNQEVSTTINVVAPNLSVSKSHTGTFTQGSTATWNVVVSNTATGSITSGTTTVSDTLPNGYTLSSFSGSGWSCSGVGTVTCTSIQGIVGGSTFPTLQIIVNVPANSPTSVTNTAAAFGGGDPNHATPATAATGTDSGVPVKQVPASIIINGSSTQSTPVNTAFGSLAVTVEDANSVVIPNYSSVTFTATTGSSGQSGTFSNSTGTISVSTNGSGVTDPGTFTANGTAGTYTVGVAAGSATATFFLTNTPIIVAAPTSTSVSSNNNPSFTAAPGNSVTFTATVTSNTTVNEGTVTFSDPANDFTCSGGNTVAISNGTAACTTSFTTEGSRVITAAYNGTVNFQISSGMVTQGVNNHTVVTGNQFCNPGTITVPSTAGAATPYPSNIFVTGLGNIAAVTVNLNNISSSDIAQTDLLLVGPTGAQIIPFASVGDGSMIAGVNITLADTASSLIPAGSPLVSGSYMPTSKTGSTSLVFPAPAPAVTAANYAATDGSATLTSTFQNTAANGTWALYAMDNSGNGAASIGGGWCVNITPVTAAVTVTKSVTSTGPYNAVGQSISYSFVAKNTGNVTLNTVGITDTQTAPAGALASGPTCQSLSSPSGTCSGSTTTLAPGQSATFTGTYTITQADLNNGSVSDSATASGTPPTGSTVTSTPSTATVTTTSSPALTVTKSVTSTGPYNAVGQTISYSFIARNTGNVTLNTVGITDTQTAPAGTLTSGPTCQSLSNPSGICSGSTTTLAPGQNATFTGTYAITQADLTNGSVSDSATASGTPPTGSTVTSTPSTATVTLTNTVQITITTSPANLLVSVDGGTFTAAPLVESWIASSSHTIATTSPQSGGTGIQFVFNTWSDGGGISHSITVPSIATTYTASFSTQFQLTTAANPTNGGTVSPASGAFINSGTMVPLMATPNTGFAFSSWTGNVANASAASTTVTMTAPQSVIANFTATRPMVNLKPISVNFGTVHLSSTHSEVVTVTNTGSATLNFKNVSLTETAGNPDSFTFLNSCGATLAPTNSCTITIGFSANKIGSSSATLNITDNAASSPQHVPISATVINPRASLNPQSLNFSTHKVGSSTVKDVILTNNGTTMLRVIGIAITGADQGDFSETDLCPSSLNAGDKCTIFVTFNPQAKGVRSAGLTVTDNAVVSSETVTLSGTGD